MEATNPVQNTDMSETRNGLLYPMMLIAAIAVIAFSVVGIATMTGVMPKALSTNEQGLSTNGQALSKNEQTAPESSRKSTRAATSPKPARARVAAAAPNNGSATGACADCGVVESIRAVQSKGQGSGLGAVAGGVLGGILGNQVGRGGGRTAATVVGAGAGAYAGHEIEKNVNKSVNYQIGVRMNDGTYRTFYEHSQPALSVGQKVRVTNNGIVAAG